MISKREKKKKSSKISLNHTKQGKKEEKKFNAKHQLISAPTAATATNFLFIFQKETNIKDEHFQFNTASKYMKKIKNHINTLSKKNSQKYNYKEKSQYIFFLFFAKIVFLQKKKEKQYGLE